MYPFVSERAESSDTESSEALARTHDEEGETVEEGQEEEEEEDSLSVFSNQEDAEGDSRSQPEDSTGESLMQKFVEEASRKAKELKEKSELLRTSFLYYL